MSLGLWLTLLLSVVLETQTIDEGTLALAVASCGSVLPEQCSAGPESADYHVQLRADPGLTEVQIDVHGPDGAITASRLLTLDAAAPREERARTLGLVIAAQVMGQAPPPAEAPPPPSEPVKTPTVVAAPRNHYTLDLAALASSALDRVAVGGIIRGSWRREHVGLLAAVRGAARPGDDPRLWWLGLSAGALLHGERKRLALEGRMELVAQRLEARAEDERANTYRLGGQLGVDGFVRLAGRIWFFVGAEAALLGPPVALNLRGQEFGAAPTVSWGAQAGFRHAW